MNWRRAVKGSIGVLVGSFTLGGVISAVKSAKELKETKKHTDELIKESDSLIAKAKKQNEELERMTKSFEREIDQIRAELNGEKKDDPQKAEFERLIKKADILLGKEKPFD